MNNAISIKTGLLISHKNEHMWLMQWIAIALIKNVHINMIILIEKTKSFKTVIKEFKVIWLSKRIKYIHVKKMHALGRINKFVFVWIDNLNFSNSLCFLWLEIL